MSTHNRIESKFLLANDLNHMAKLSKDRKLMRLKWASSGAHTIPQAKYISF